MMNEFIKENETIVEEHSQSENVVSADEKSEFRKKTAPVDRMGKLIEKRELLKEKLAKSIENEKSAANRTKLIEAQIAKVEKEIHAEEVAKMDKFCSERNFTYDDIMGYFKRFSKDATMEDISAMTQ